ncbi:MAG: hypothetical protein V3T83_07675 [Acidobacteriota bacterium]
MPLSRLKTATAIPRAARPVAPSITLPEMDPPKRSRKFSLASGRLPEALFALCWREAPTDRNDVS